MQLEKPSVASSEVFQSTGDCLKAFCATTYAALEKRFRGPLLRSPDLERKLGDIAYARTAELQGSSDLEYAAAVYAPREDRDWGNDGLGQLIRADGWLLQATPGTPSAQWQRHVVDNRDSFLITVRGQPAELYRGGEDSDPIRYWIVTWYEVSGGESFAVSLIGPDVAKAEVTAIAQNLVER